MKNFTLLLVFFLTTFLAFAQTSLTAGDIAFLGVNTDGVTDADDSFAFVLLKDVEANTTITFTDRGWNDGTGFVEPLAIGDGELIWTSTTALSVGEVVILNFANLSPGAAVFTVLGDQLFAIQGTISSPIFIAGMQLNIGVGSDDANWDGAATSNTTSALPDALTTGDTAIRFPIEQDNWQFSCSTGLCPLSGTAEEIRAILHNPANWINDNTNVFPGTVNVNLGTITVGPVNTPPTITSSSTANVEENQTIAIHVEASDDIDIEGPGLTYSLTGDGVDQLLFNINEVTGEVSFMNAPDFENPEDEGGNNIYEFQVTVTDSGGLASMQDISITVTNVDDTSPTISSLTPFSGATDVAVDANLVVEFNEEVQAVSGNNIIILANLVPVVTIPIDDSQVTIGGSTLTIIPIADLPSNASISVGIPDGGLKDLAGNDFRGIDPTTGWVFTTAVPVDNTPPVITCPGDIVFDSFSSVECGDIVNWDAPIVTDNFPGVTVTSNFNSGDLFPIGTTEVVYTATDAAGNQAECKFMVTVNDAKAPTPICINGLTVTLDATTGLQTIAATDFIASPITDACGPVTYTISRATVDPNSDVRSSSLILNCDDEETTLIRVWAEDKNGNSDFCETYILVDKSQFMCPAPLIVDLELDVTTLNPTPVVSGAIVNYLYTLTNKGSSTATGIEVEVIFPTGINFISSGFPGGTFFNFTTKIWSIPSLAAGITRTLVISGNVNGNGDYMTLAEVIAQNETDIDSTPGNGVDTDGDGNVIDDPEDEDDGDAETVTPIDNDPPVAVCQDVMVQLDPNGNTTVSVTDIDNGSTDNGAIVSYGVRRSVARMFDQNATPDAIFGSGNANGSFTNNQTGSVELGLRAKVRYPTPMNTFNSNGDGTYQHLAIAGSPASRAGWNFEWSVNTDPSGTAGDKLSGLTYEMGIDFDASTGTDYYVFDPINQPFADHAIGTNMTANGGGVEATDPASYAGLLAANNVAQNSWNLDFFNELAGKTFDPTVDGTYEVYLKAFDGSGAKVGETKITVIVGNGGAPGLLPQSIDFTNADIGTNLVELIVVDAAGNTAICTSTVTVKSACEVVIEAQPMDVVVCEKEPYSFRVEATGNGMLSYQWEYLFAVDASWDTYPNATENVLDIPAQGAVIHADGWLFRVRVTSDNGTPNDATDDCTTTSETATLTVNPLPVVEITGKDSYCNNGNGVVLDAGAGHSSYLWSPGGETTQTITALEGSYTVEVTYEFGCIKTSEAFMVTNNQPLDCNILQDVLATDHLTNDGVATVNITGGTGHYMYLWDNGETTQTATTLTYGMHSVTVTDSNGCETTCQIDIAKELYCWTNLVQNVSIRGGNDGAARVKGNGGYRPYTYKWEDGSTNEVNSTLTPGTHYVTITDASGATSQCSVIITEPTGGDCDTFILNVEQDKLSTDHLTADGVATVHPKGGAAQYTYLWDNGERTQTASKLTYGVHSVTVTDANGCEASSQIDIAKELYCWTNLIKNESSYGSNDGAAQVRGNGGYRPYTFKWDDGSSEELNSSLGAGTHYVTITDATGATSRCSVIIEGPNQEICDGIDNDGDGKIDEGFDQDGDGIADCFDICSQGDDHVDMDYDGIPDACDDNICVKGEKPKTECYQTAVWNIQTCSWDITGEQPEMPMTECYQTAVWNNATCTWDIFDEQPEMPMTECYQTAVWNDAICTWDILDEQPEMPMTECYQTAVWNDATCTWDILDEQPEMPMTECYQTAVWNDATCSWDILDEQPEMPMTECYQTAVWNDATCSWDILDEQPEMPMTECYQTAAWDSQTCSWEVTGEQPEMPMTECYQTAVWNGATCTWDILDEQPEMPMTECYQTAAWDSQTCSWEVTGEQPEMPMTECYQTAVWNTQTCSWEATGEQPEMPMTECYQTVAWNAQTCSWEVTGEQPEMPMTECYQTAEWNTQTCSWEVTGEQPEMPETECNETAEWNAQTCNWDIFQNNNDCGSGTIDQCETAFARSTNENVRTCFLDISGITANRWGWTNSIPSVNGSYELELYAAAGQCDITKGALVGNVIVVYENGLVDVTVSVLNGYKMTEAQLYVGGSPIPLRNNGSQTVAPGQYPYHDDVNGDFYAYTFENLNPGDMDNFYVIFHAKVCPNETDGMKSAPSSVMLTAYPIPFKKEINLKITTPRKMSGELYIYDAIGQKVEDFGMHNLKKGENEIKLQVVELPVGMYFIHVKSDYGNEVLKVLRH